MKKLTVASVLIFCLMAFACVFAYAEDLLVLGSDTAKIEIYCDATYDEQGGPFAPQEVVLYDLDDEVLSLLIVGGSLLDAESGWMGYQWEGAFSAYEAGDYQITVRGASGSSLTATWSVGKKTLSHSSIDTLLAACSVQRADGTAPQFGDSLSGLTLSPDPGLTPCTVTWTHPDQSIQTLTSDGRFSQSVSLALQDPNYQLENGTPTGIYSFTFSVEPMRIGQVGWPVLSASQITYGESLPALLQADQTGIPGARFQWQHTGPVTEDAGATPHTFWMELTDLNPLHYALDGCADTQAYQFTILPSPIILNGWGLPASHSYDGTPLTPQPSLSQSVTLPALIPAQDYEIRILDENQRETPLQSAGHYEITLTLTNDNFTFPEGSSKSTSFHILPRELPVRAELGQQKWYGQADPPLRHQAPLSSFALAESPTFSGELRRAAGEEPGSYLIEQGSFTCENLNYVLQFEQITTFTIVSFTPGNLSAAIDGTPLPDGAYVDPVHLQAPAGYHLSVGADPLAGSWSDRLPVEGPGAHSFTYYLRSTEGTTRDAICGPFTVTFTLADSVDPTVSPLQTPSPTDSPPAHHSPMLSPEPVPVPSAAPTTPSSGSGASSAGSAVLGASDAAPADWDDPLLEWILYGRALADLPLITPADDDVPLPHTTGWNWTHFLAPVQNPSLPGEPMEVFYLSQDHTWGLGFSAPVLYRFSLADNPFSLSWSLDLSTLLSPEKDRVFALIPCDLGETLLLGSWDPQTQQLAGDLCLLWLPGHVATTLPGTQGAQWFGLSPDGAAVAYQQENRLARLFAGSKSMETIASPDFPPAFGAAYQLLTGIHETDLGLWWTLEDTLEPMDLPTLFPGGQRGIRLTRRHWNAQTRTLHEEAVGSILMLDLTTQRLYFSPSGIPLFER